MFSTATLPNPHVHAPTVQAPVTQLCTGRQQGNHGHCVILDTRLSHPPEQVHRLCCPPSIRAPINHGRPCHRVPPRHLAKKPQRGVHLAALIVCGEHAVSRGHRLG
ncbi:hypothetical protein SORBI_3002G015332 [Sorghum bicolor]|uniref:Uncharacterized protein n=1 Tax=Sorghum bicolor TaxID=4558 RepID=A0A1W0W1W8_SORBI|nr:hypothetical protein SORBI_3002G015332 [Sorghum bicolor]